MKRQTPTLLRTLILPLITIATGMGVSVPAQAAPETTLPETTLRKVDCTPAVCSAFRANYEDAIESDIINRPSLVSDAGEALKLANQAIYWDDRDNAARRYAQALVIISENQGTPEALAVERSLDAQFLRQYEQTLREYMPTFAKIMPIAESPYR